MFQGAESPPSQPNTASGGKPLSQNSKPGNPVASVFPPEKQPAPLTGSMSAAHHRKTVSFLEEYFSVQILDEALQCVEELKAPACHPEVTKEEISLALEKIPPRLDPIIKLLEYLLNKEVVTPKDIATGCL